MGVWQLHGADQVFSEHLRTREKARAQHSQSTTPNTEAEVWRWRPTSAGFLGLEAGVPGLLPYLLDEQKEVEGPK